MAMRRIAHRQSKIRYSVGGRSRGNAGLRGSWSRCPVPPD